MSERTRESMLQEWATRSDCFYPISFEEVDKLASEECRFVGGNGKHAWVFERKAMAATAIQKMIDRGQSHQKIEEF